MKKKSTNSFDISIRINKNDSFEMSMIEDIKILLSQMYKDGSYFRYKKNILSNYLINRIYDIYKKKLLKSKNQDELSENDILTSEKFSSLLKRINVIYNTSEIIIGKNLYDMKDDIDGENVIIYTFCVFIPAGFLTLLETTHDENENTFCKENSYSVKKLQNFNLKTLERI